MIDIVLNDKIGNLSDYTFIEGFPGIGLVGPMAINYMIEKLKMEYCGYITSDKFPPLIAIHDSVPLPPVRFYFSKEHKLITIFSEFQIPMELIFDISNELGEFLTKNKIKNIISVNGMPQQPTNSNEPASDKVFAMVSDLSLNDKLSKNSIEKVNEGVSTGISALLMISALKNKISDISLLIPVNPQIVDPKYAESAIVYLNKLLNLNIDTKELDKEAKEVESKIKEIIKKNKEGHQSYKDSYNNGYTGPSMYA